MGSKLCGCLNNNNEAQSGETNVIIYVFYIINLLIPVYFIP